MYRFICYTIYSIIYQQFISAKLFLVYQCNITLTHHLQNWFSNVCKHECRLTRETDGFCKSISICLCICFCICLCICFCICLCICLVTYNHKSQRMTVTLCLVTYNYKSQRMIVTLCLVTYNYQRMTVTLCGTKPRILSKTLSGRV